MSQVELGDRKLRVTVEGTKYPFKGIPLLEDGEVIAVAPVEGAVALRDRLSPPPPTEPKKKAKRKRGR